MRPRLMLPAAYTVVLKRTMRTRKNFFALVECGKSTTRPPEKPTFIAAFVSRAACADGKSSRHDYQSIGGNVRHLLIPRSTSFRHIDQSIASIPDLLTGDIFAAQLDRPLLGSDTAFQKTSSFVFLGHVRSCPRNEKLEQRMDRSNRSTGHNPTSSTQRTDRVAEPLHCRDTDGTIKGSRAHRKSLTKILKTQITLYFSFQGHV